ncbi:UNVERIFIED_CONTAM: hypothetical protein Sangu_1583200 [Sesamum angustifolium]|uniref:Secreted protein n=1 Tax=Sesamum angustifolium TaxID=2727405 RepID=A0AAW2MUC6_9LAMI
MSPPMLKCTYIALRMIINAAIIVLQKLNPHSLPQIQLFLCWDILQTFVILYTTYPPSPDGKARIGVELNGAFLFSKFVRGFATTEKSFTNLL